MPEARHLNGWKRDKPDRRDFKYRALFTLPRAQLPPEIDLRDEMSAVENQGQVGSCTANAVVGSLEYLKRERLSRKFLCTTVRRDLSRLFVYYNTRALEGTVDVDSGASIRSAIKAVANDGVCYEKDWPYDALKWDRKPPEGCYRTAAKYKIVSYYRVESVDEALNALSQRLPVAFGAVLFESFGDAATTGRVEMPRKGERQIGGHAMLLVGYSQPKEEFIVRNSWGEQWGLAGYCRMPWSYCLFGKYVDDFWTVKG